jgi:O-antigen/teichoic acid export membrane protein
VGINLLSSITSGFTGGVTLGVTIGTSLLFFQAIYLSANAILQSRLLFNRSAVALILGSLTTLVTVVLLTKYYESSFKNELVGIVALILGTFVAGIINLVMIKPYVSSFKLTVDIALWTKLIRQSLPLGLTLIFNLVYFRIDTLILAFYRTNFEVGAYGFAYKFFEFTIALPFFLMNSLYPVLLKQKGSPPKLWQVLKPWFIILVVTSIGLSIVMWLGAPIIGFIKNDYKTSVSLVRLLSWSVPLFYLTSPLMWVYIIYGWERPLTIIYGGSLVFNIIVNLILIPDYGAQAAAITTGLSEALVFVAMLIYFKIKRLRYV